MYLLIWKVMIFIKFCSEIRISSLKNVILSEKKVFFTKRSEIVPSFQNVQNYENRTKNAKVRTKLRFLRFSDFRQKSASKKWPKFQIGVLVSGCPKIRKISFLRCFMENALKKQENSKNLSEKWFGAGKVLKIHFFWHQWFFAPLI